MIENANFTVDLAFDGIKKQHENSCNRLQMNTYRNKQCCTPLMATELYLKKVCPSSFFTISLVLCEELGAIDKKLIHCLVLKIY